MEDLSYCNNVMEFRNHAGLAVTLSPLFIYFVRLVSAINQIAHSERLLKQIFISKKYSEHGIYALKLYKDGEWIGVLVDDRIPCDQHDSPIFARVRPMTDHYRWVF